MKVTKNLVYVTLQKWTPDQIEAFQAITDDAWEKYVQYLRIYWGGASSEVGWYSQIVGALMDVGVPKPLASALSVIRSDVCNASE